MSPKGRVKNVRTVNLGGYRKARVWIGELPDAVFQPTGTRVQMYEASGSGPGLPSLAAVELSVFVSARFIYGLIGGDWRPNAAGELRVSIHTSSSNGTLLPDHLSARGEDVRVGLPDEYSEGVLAGVQQWVEALEVVPSGELTINCAAHGLVSSSQMAFKRVSWTLCKLLTTDGAALTDEELNSFFPLTM
jgi:hypothetical protein